MKGCKKDKNDKKEKKEKKEKKDKEEVLTPEQKERNETLAKELEEVLKINPKRALRMVTKHADLTKE